MLKEKKTNKLLKYTRPMLTLVIVSALLTGAVSASSIKDVKDKYTKEGTPFQVTIKEDIAKGKIFDIEGTKFDIEILEENETYIKFKAKSTITFNNPKGAGYTDNKWPSFAVGKDIGDIKAGNYDQKIKDSIQKEIENIKDKKEKAEKLTKWKNYNFESGKRTFEFVETYEITDQEPTISTDSSVSTASLQNNNYDILMGFTHRLDYNYYREASVYVLWWQVAWVRASAYISGVLGLRLPTTVNLLMPDSMSSEQSYYLNTAINGADWDAAKYSSVLIDQRLVENGKEFVARLGVTLGLQGWIKYIGNFGPYYIYKGIDKGQNFKTPIGPNEQFPIPDLFLPPTMTGLKQDFGVGYLGLGLKIDPDLGSKDITANWYTYGDSVGNGLARYNLPNTYYNFGPITAGDYSSVTDYANVVLYNYKYYFSLCRLSLGTNFQVKINYIPSLETPYYNIYSRDCSSITGGLYLGTHPGTYANYVYGNSPVYQVSVQPVAATD